MLETLIIGIGSSIAGATLKMWLHEDHPVAAAASTKITEILLKALPNKFKERRATERQFEEIADKAGTSILKLLENEKSEHKSLEDARIEVVANAASETINNIEFTSAFLAEKTDLQAEKLTNFLLGRIAAEGGSPGLSGDLDNPAAAFFSDVEREIYRKILDHAAQLIVDIASQLPHFSERVLGEILTRQTDFAVKADRIINDLQRIRDVMSGGDRLAEDFEARYRAKIVRQLDRLELFGVDLQECNKRYQLSVAYVSLQLERPIQGGSGETIFQRLDVDEALIYTKKLFLRGDPGSGKTTLLQWIAVNAANGLFSGKLTPWNKYVPFFIRLRSHSNRKQLPNPDEFINEVAQTIKDEMPKGWVNHLMRSGRALILIDGLDEIPDDRHEKVRTWLEELTSDYPRSCFILTSRPYAQDGDWLQEQMFGTAMLKDMPEEGINVFVNQWHEAVLRETSEDDEIERVTRLRDQLRTEFRRRRDLNALGRRPLLCAMICAYHREKDGNLPANRIKLYEACVQMLLDRDKRPGIRIRNYVNIKDDQKIPILRRFAWWMVQEEMSEISNDRAFDFLTTVGSEMGIEPPVPRVDIKTEPHFLGKEIARYFIDRTGIIREPRDGILDFPHKTLLEYLAANAATFNSAVSQLAASAHTQGWQEIVIMAAGMMPKRDLNHLIERLMGAFEDEDEGRLRAFVACGCLETVSELDTKIRAQLTTKVEELLPPASVQEAKQIALVGDLVIPWIHDLINLESEEKVATIHLMGAVNTPWAMQKVADEPFWESEEERQRLFDSILDAKDPVEFGNLISRILFGDQLTVLSEASVSQWSLKKIGYKPNRSAFKKMMAALDFRSVKIQDINPLGECANVNSLDLYRTDVLDIGILNKIPNLEYLDITHTTIKDISSLAACKKLHSLFMGSTQVTDLSALSHCSNLQKLGLICTKVNDLTPLSSCENLSILDLRYTEVSKLDVLESCANLEEIHLKGSKVSDDQREKIARRIPQLNIHD